MFKLQLSKLSKQTWVLAFFCLADLITTICLLKKYGADEANPLMSMFLARGVAAFILAKLFFTVGPISILEWAHRKKPLTGKIALNVAIVSYLCVYGAGVARINRSTLLEEGTQRINDDPVMDRMWASTSTHLKQLQSQCREYNYQLSLSPMADPTPCTYGGNADS
ncbi:MAG: DUF5658 family protein [Chthonomonadales bacterium]